MPSVKSAIALVALTGLIAGCSTQSVTEQKREAAIEKADSQLSSVPDWYLSPPKSTEESIYGAGTAFSADMQNAVRKAALQANYELAQTYKQSISGSEKSFIREQGTAEGGKLESENEAVISKLVADADVSGSEVIKKEVIREGTGFRAYVLSQYKTGASNLIKQEKAKEEESKNIRQSAEEAYKELDQKVSNVTSKP